MELNFPFKSGITATVNVIDKIVDASTLYCGELSKASKCVNADRHWDVIEVINNLYIDKGGDCMDIKYDEHYVRIYPFDSVSYSLPQFINELESLLYDYKVDIKHYSDMHIITYDIVDEGVLIATIYQN